MFYVQRGATAAHAHQDGWHYKLKPIKSQIESKSESESEFESESKSKSESESESETD